MINVVVKMVTVVPIPNSVHFHKDVNQNSVNVLKEDVEKNGDLVLMINVVVRMDIVVQHLNFVPSLKDVNPNLVLPQNSVLPNKDVNPNMVNVLKIDVEKNGDHVLMVNVVVKKDIVEPLLNFVLLP